MQIVREDKSDFHMQENVLKTFQLIVKIFMTTFFVDIVTFYLLFELIFLMRNSFSNQCHLLEISTEKK